MIKLFVNDSPIVLEEDVKIRLEFNSPVFDEEAITGSRTYWFDIPFAPKNQKLFGFAEIPSIEGKLKVFDQASLYFGGFKIFSGKLYLKKITGKYRALLTTNSFGNDNKEKRLTDLDLGSPISIGSTTQDVVNHANTRITYNYPNTNYNFPIIYNPAFYGDKNPAFSKPPQYPGAHFPFVNSYAPAEDTFKENYLFEPDTDEDVPDGIGNFYTLCPIVYLQYLLSKIFKNYTLTGRFVDDSDFQQLMIYNNYALDDTSDEYNVQADSPQWNTLSEWATIVVEFTDYTIATQMTFDGAAVTVNQKGHHKFKVKLTFDDSGGIEDSYIIWLSLYDSNNDWIKDIKKHEFTPSSLPHTEEIEHTYYFSDSDVGKKVLMRFSDHAGIGPESNITFSGGSFDIVNYSQENLNRYAKEIDLSNHVPHVKIGKFLNQLKDFFALAYYFDNQRKKIQFFLKDDIFETGYKDITNLVEPEMDIQLNDETNKIFTYDFEDDEYTEDNFKAYSKYNLSATVNAFASAPDPTSIKNIIKVRAENAIYKVEKHLDFGNVWQHFTDINQRLEMQNSGKEESKDIELTPLLMKGIYYKGGKYIASMFHVPKIKQNGYSVIYNSDQEKDDTLRILNWIGMVDYDHFSNTYDYPLATSGQYDPQGNKIANFSLFLNGAEGIAETFHRRWEDWQSFTEKVEVIGNHEINIKELFDLIQIVAFPQDETIQNQRRWFMIRNTKYIPRKMDVEISTTGIDTVKFELMKRAY